MNDQESSQSAELDSDHRDIDPSLGTGLGGFVIAHESPVPHLSAEGSLHHDPAERQNFEASGIVRTFDDRDGQLGAQRLSTMIFSGIVFLENEARQAGDVQPGPKTKNSSSLFEHCELLTTSP